MRSWGRLFGTRDRRSSELSDSQLRTRLRGDQSAGVSGKVASSSSVTRIDVAGEAGTLSWDTVGMDHDECWPVLRAEFASAVRLGTAVTADVARGLMISRMLDAAQRSVRSVGRQGRACDRLTPLSASRRAGSADEIVDFCVIQQGRVDIGGVQMAVDFQAQDAVQPGPAGHAQTERCRRQRRFVGA